MRVLLAMPRYGEAVNFEAATALYQPILPGSELQVRLRAPSGSLLACVFNSAWARACDLYDAGELDGFAMIHSDIAPPPGWLDVLHREMLATGADVIAAAVPIKDDRGLSSTGVDDTGDPWRIRRLTMRQLKDLPETFTEADVGGPLLLNTGLWFCRLGPWCDRVCFTIRDTIRKEPDRDGKLRRKARVQPEDWDFSRQCRALGLNLAATRKVVVRHFGEEFWSNQDVWGWDHDMQNAPRSEEQTSVPASPEPALAGS
jgi:hypothetical protein